ncbi:hypothetical protein [Pseudovibrio sp. Tun.PSC04-5.I4]|uniref:hypothetical protein n=1 Tax=Pseudovibrio sp. Tun.PSC04-5.I4 TaxID=1798213 RepID=UPI00088C8C3B|nr:hypothetical protein [Pseudovibrio sp. Tun.PSC04-5.I4]SDR33052.1 hypothetical protein SAMN04515695_4567 [Pseudovibrio sp. Tun.PSC04-5.I4]
MRDPNNDSVETVQDELDPAALRLQSKLRRLLMGSSLVMVLGLLAVFAAIFYKINANNSNVTADNVAATIAIGPQAQVMSVTQMDGKLVMLIKEGTTQALVYIDPVTGRKIARTDFVAR